MSFAVDVSKFGALTAEKIDLATRKIALDLFGRVIMRTPVDTGRLRGNWQTGVDALPSGDTDRLDSGPVAQSGQNAAIASKAYAEAADTITRARRGAVFYLANNLPYAPVIEYEGHSPQAPGGMVRISLLEAESILEDAVGAADKEARQ